jgi:hypothetical protein
VRPVTSGPFAFDYLYESDQVEPDAAAWSSASMSPRKRVTAAVRVDTPSLA